jgi:hypothetical protein
MRTKRSDAKKRTVEGEPEPGGVVDLTSAVDVGDTVTVVWGKESFSPIRYFNIEVGPFRLTVRVREGEHVNDTIKRANDVLEAHAEKVWKVKLADHLERVRQSHRLVEVMKGKG